MERLSKAFDKDIVEERLLGTGKIIQVDNIDGTKFMSKPNNHAWDQHDCHCNRKEDGRISDSYDGGVIVIVDQILRRMLQGLGYRKLRNKTIDS